MQAPYAPSRLDTPPGLNAALSHRYSVASTSASTLYDRDEGVDTPDAVYGHHTRPGQVSSRRQHKASSESLGKPRQLPRVITSKPSTSKITLEDLDAHERGLYDEELHVRNSQDDFLFLEDEQQGEQTDPWDYEVDTDAHFLSKSIEGEDHLDRLIRVSSSLLRVSKSILASSKRISVVNGAIAQTSTNQEYELRRHVESLEQQDRFLALMSSDAHAIMYPTPGSGVTEFAAPRLRQRSSGSSSISLAQAKTLYVHASSSSLTGRTQGGIAEEDEDAHEAFQNTGSHLTAPNSKTTTSDTLVPSPTYSAVSSSPSTFFSSLFSRSNVSTNISSSNSESPPKKTSLPSTPAPRDAKKDARSLLTALANSNGSKASASAPASVAAFSACTPSSVPSPSMSRGLPKSVSQLFASTSSASPSPPPVMEAALSSASPTPARHHSRHASLAPASAQLSSIQANAPHLTLSSRRRGHHRSTLSLSESLLRASASTAISNTNSRLSSMPEEPSQERVSRVPMVPGAA